jgi:iron complex transport system ATP-binding protein
LALNLTVNKLSFKYDGTQVLKDVNLEVKIGEMLSIVGPNGSGKSTLLKCINRILKTQQNTVLIDGEDTNKLNLKELSKIMGYVPQSSTNTFPFTVFDIVLMGRKPYIHWSLSERDTEIVAEMMDYIGIGDLAMRHFNELSGGEQQKVIIARALAQQPQFLLLDEPTSSLDIRHQLEILCILKSLAKTNHCSVIVAMHDLNLASRFSDRMLMLKKGSIFTVGTPDAVLTKENIESVYGIKTQVTNSILGSPQITPLISEFNGIKPLKTPPQIETIKSRA